MERDGLGVCQTEGGRAGGENKGPLGWDVPVYGTGCIRN